MIFLNDEFHHLCCPLKVITWIISVTIVRYQNKISPRKALLYNCCMIKFLLVRDQ